MVNNLNAEALRNALVVASMEYCKKYLEGQNVDKTEDIKAQIAKLEANGLGRTKNAEVLRTLLTAKGSSKSRDEIASLIGRIKKVSPSCMIVPYDDFFKVLKKYNLACGPISTYKGVIPEENIEAIVKAGKELHKIKNINNMQWIPRIDIDSDMPKSMVNEIVEYFSRFPFVVDGISFGWQYMRAIGHPEVEDSVSFNSYTLNDNDWCIAAPYDTMTDNITIRMYSGKEEARKRQLEDPIVFKANEIGAIIATMWDTEATDSIFDKYR